MFIVWIVAALAMLAGAYSLLGSETAPALPSLSSASLASNMSQYRAALVTFAQANPSFTGSVPPSSLQPLMSPNIANPLWQNYVTPNSGIAGSTVVVYASSTTASPAIADIEQLAQGSALAGVAFNGDIVSPGNPSVALPVAIAAKVPNGVPVWMAQAYD
jgi:hypothetical protein